MNLAEAIETRTVIEFVYDGLPRIVLPAAVGFHASTGNPVLRGYQVGGSGRTRPVPFWDMFRLDRIGTVQITSEHFTDNPPGYRRGDTHINPIQREL